MFKKKLTIPVLNQAETAYKSMAPSERWLLYILASILALTVFIMAMGIYYRFTVLVPESGGSITEGVVGAPRFINPVLAISQTDKDMVELVYAGLMSMDEDGNLIPELAESFTISEDATEYSFILRDGLTFHDGTPLTADDVIFTIEKAIQPDIKSPERANWEGVSIKQDGELTITFSLNKPYSPFLQNTTLGILPEEHWSKLTADEFIFSSLNTAPIGSGPYSFVEATHNSSGIPSSISLTRFKDFVLGTPFIKHVTINFYANKDLQEQALSNKSVSSIRETTPNSMESLVKQGDHTIMTSTLPRIFAVFFNQSHNEILEDKDVRKILRSVIDTEHLINTVLSGYATSIDSPVLVPVSDTLNSGTLTASEARALLEEDGWVADDSSGIYSRKGTRLSITLTTANSAELKEVANYVSAKWSNIGVDVKLEVFESGDIAQSVLRTRNYDALLFGEILGTNPDPYAFWHSSQRNDPGLNIANYANPTVDKLLLKARKTVDNNDRADLYKKLSAEIQADIPAVFLYAPHFIYITNKNILGIKFPESMEPHDRFANIHKWHLNTNRTLKLFAN